jgi:hypothetical protein
VLKTKILLLCLLERICKYFFGIKIAYNNRQIKKEEFPTYVQVLIPEGIGEAYYIYIDITLCEHN